ncbi:claudin-7-like [Aotus nancymaae]|uniref:claudin-7-like n=1 Tax=Aotus nancymaae TaxID=37293 RepID=UPI0030FE33EF
MEVANLGLQLLNFSMALLGWVGPVACTAILQWQISSCVGNSIITAQAMYKGLWMNYIMQTMGLMSCEIYDLVLTLPAAMQAPQALMMASLVLGFLTMCVATMGMECMCCGESDKVKNARIVDMVGVIFIMAGMSLFLLSLLAGQGLLWPS